MTIRRVALIFDDTVRQDTTGTYCRRALEKLVEVEHFLPGSLAKVPRSGFDLYLNVDDGLRYRFPGDLRPCAFWAIDTHLDFEWYRTKAGDFDFVLAAQRDGAQRLHSEGIPSAQWLPLACDPEVHRKHDVPKRYDVCFVGNLLPGERTEAVQHLQKHFADMFVGRRYFDEMAQTYSASRVVFNRSVLGDVNMRVFEALACGSLLVTNDLSSNGQAELFRDGEHLVTYCDLDELVEKITYYLEHEDERERIAAAGREAVLAAHTCRHRMETLLSEVETTRKETVTNCGTERAQRPTDPSPSYYELSRPELLALVPATARRVLDVGCAAGCLGQAIKARQKASVCGIELSPEVARTAEQHLDEVIIGDVEEMELSFEEGHFDCIVCGDVLEHLQRPKQFLRQARRWLAPGGCLVASIPNVRYHSVIRGLLAGDWSYEPAGLLDRGHLRFFTRREIEKLFYRAGYRLCRIEPIPNPDHDQWQRCGRPGELRAGSLQIRGMTGDEAGEFYVIQYLVEAAPRETPDRGLTSIIILTHNQLQYTRLCVDNILRYTDEPIELIFVDNASMDGTPDYLRTVPGAKLIANSTNRGFPAGANQGIGAAAGQNVLLLNNDVVVTTGWLDRLLQALYSGPNVGLVGPVSNNVSGSQQIRVAYDDLARLDGFAWEHGKVNDGRYFPTDRLVGFALLIRREVIQRIGLFDERFGIGCFEDDDFCRRAAADGYRLLIASDAFLHHFGSQTFRASGVHLGQVLRENERVYRKKWEGDASAQGAKGPPPDPSAKAPAPARPWVVRSAPEGGLLLETSRLLENGTGSEPIPAEPDSADPSGGACPLFQRDAKQPVISLCMICRDNAGTIEACLNSIRPWVDEMIVVDTGSKDDTPDLARACGAQLHHFPWCDDFAAARNESLKHARGDWVFWMDSDDTIDPERGRKLRELAAGASDPSILGYVMQVHCPGAGEDGKTEVTVVDHVKLFRNRPDLRFEGRIHEQALTLFAEAVRRRPDDRDALHARCQFLFEQGPPDEAECALRDLADRFPDAAAARHNLGSLHLQTGRYDEAIQAYRESIRLRPDHVPTHIQLGHALLAAGRTAKAAASWQEALRRDPRNRAARQALDHVLSVAAAAGASSPAD